MIQDIAPHLFNNQYKNSQPFDGDIVFSFDNDTVAILTYKEEFGKKLRYAFSIDNTKYFLTETIYENMNYQSLKDISNTISNEINFATVTAHQLYLWYKSNKFCGQCGCKMTHSIDERKLLCSNCGNELYPNISPAIIVGIVHNNKILVTKYAGREYKNYALIAGFAEIGETIEETVRREVMEEVGLKVKNIEFYKSQPWAYSNSLLMGFWAELDGDNNIVLDETELSTAKWLSPDEIDMNFDNISLTHEMIALFKHQNAPVLIS